MNALSIVWEQYGDLIALSLGLIVATITVLHILLFKANSPAALLWIGLVVLIPFIGAAIYWVFGINRVWNRHRQASQPRLTEQSFTAERLPTGIDQLRALQQVGGRITGRSLGPLMIWIY